MAFEAIQSLLLAMADDELCLGHRDAEWTGHAPIIEEDIAFANIAQDEIGHALIWYQLREQLGGENPDDLAFLRGPEEFTCCHLVEQPKGDFAFTIVRQFLFDAAEKVRLEALRTSSHVPLREAAEKILPEEEYHLLHTRSWVERLGNGTEESHRRMSAALEVAFPLALGLFEPPEGEPELVAEEVFPGNEPLQDSWLRLVVPVLQDASLMPPVERADAGWTPSCSAVCGGRRGQHTPALTQLLADFQQVRRTDPVAAW